MSQAEVVCKKICVLRCLLAISLSIAIQYLLLSVFLLFVNFNIFHPIAWITETFSIVFSFYTWLCIMPLIIAVTLYGIFLGNSHLTVKRYYPTRFSYIRSTILKKIISFMIHGTVGFLTAWLYSRFLQENYRTIFFDCFDGYCINNRYLFLAICGISTGIYFFLKERLNKEPQLKFPIIQESKYIKIRSHLYATLYSSLIKSIFPTICFTLLYWAFGWIVTKRMAILFGAEYDESMSSLYIILTNPRLIFYAWILSSQILANMYLMEIFFQILLTEQIQFPIEKDPICIKAEVTLVEALSLMKLPIVQHLASLDLFNLSNSKLPLRRQIIFSLSIPGGHPYNWNQLSGQCLSILNAFTEELATSLKNISTIKSEQIYTRIKPATATENAERILLRQYNESYGIRNMMMSQPPHYVNPSLTPSGATGPQRYDPCQTVQNAFDQFGKQCEEAFRIAFRSIPGLFYLFGEQEESRMIFVLSQSQDIIWISQALAALCAASLVEDKYGVVQCELSNIIRTLLRLKLQLDKVNSLNLSGKKIDKNCNALRGAVKRSLYRICTVFADYIRDLIEDPDELRILSCFINYQEI